MSTSKKKLTFEEKLNEYLTKMKNNDNNFIKGNNKKFSDGSNLYSFFYNNKKKIIDAIMN